MKEPPTLQGNSTDALFAVVRSELGEFVRHTMFHLDFTSPALKSMFGTVQRGLEAAELANLEKMIDEKYLKFCDPENPLHFMTTWWTRAYLAKCRLLEHHSRYSSPSVHQTDAQRDAAIFHALRMLECDTKLRTSPLTKKFLWLIHLHFPFPAYIQIAQDLRRRPGSERAEQAWEVMSDNYEAWFVFVSKDIESPFFKIFNEIVLPAWEAREVAFSQLGEPLMPPRIVSSIRHRVARIAQNAQVADTKQPNGAIDVSTDDLSISMPMGSGSHEMLYNMGGNGGYRVTGPKVYSNVLGRTPLDIDVNHLDWAAMDWGFGGVYPGFWDADL
jgi:hypothetical protein